MKKSGILDNKSLGNVISELKKNIVAGCTLSVVSALFSLYACDKLKKELSKVDKFRLLVPNLNDEDRKQFLESGELAASDKKLFRENVKNVYWEYTLKPSTCPVLPYRDNEREYLEVAVLQVEMNSQKGHKRIAEIIHRVIPYPLMLGFYTETGYVALSIAPKRFSQAEHGAFVAECFYTIGWMNSEAFNDREAAFVASLAWDSMPLQTYGTLYNAWTDRFTGYECSVLSGAFTVGKAQDRLEQLTRCREIESRISELRGHLKKAAFNRQVELNTQTKQMERALAQMVEQL